MARILVAYAAKHGSTKEVAEALTAALCEAGLQADVQAVSSALDLSPYDVVVLGGPLHRGRWHRDALGFLKRNCEALANRDVAIFALGPRKPLREGGRPRCRAQLDAALREVAWLRPVRVALFGGVDPPTRKGERRDQRDWDAVRDWAASVVECALTCC